MVARGCSFTGDYASLSDEQQQRRFNDINDALFQTQKFSILMPVIIASYLMTFHDAESDTTVTASRPQCYGLMNLIHKWLSYCTALGRSPRNSHSDVKYHI